VACDFGCKIVVVSWRRPCIRDLPRGPAIGATLAFVVACKEPNPAFMPDTDGTTSTAGSGPGSSSSGSDGPVSLTLTGATTTAASDGSTAVDGSSTTQDPTTDSDPTAGDATYPACDPMATPPCPPDESDCVQVQGGSWCAKNCDGDASVCPPPTSGTATVECAGPGGNQCALDCSANAACPDGMDCRHLTGTVYRCIWPG
jgi:hypothetical protein